jgi:hypothetical protein
MPGRPPYYTFRRSKKVSRPPLPLPQVEKELYTAVSVEEPVDEALKYAKYSFYIFLAVMILMILSLAYILKMGLPVRIRG